MSLVRSVVGDAYMNRSFNIDQQSLSSLLAAMQPICNKRTPLDVTECILFEVGPRELTLKATDLEISLQSTLEIESTLDEGVRFLVPAKRLFEIIRELQGSITVGLHENKMMITTPTLDLSLHIKDAETFPPFPERIENLMHIDANILNSLLAKVAFLIPSHNANPALNGLLIEIGPQGLALVATDGHSLARVTTTEYTLQEERTWLLPRRAVLELRKIIEVNQPGQLFLGVCGNQLVFSGPAFNFFSKLIGDTFPHYQPVLEQDGFMMGSVGKADLIKMLKRSSCLLAGQFISTTFHFQPEHLEVKIENKGVGSLHESIPFISYEGNVIDTRFFSPYLINGLQVLSKETVTFAIKNNLKPIIITETEDNKVFTYLVMPVSAVNPS